MAVARNRLTYQVGNENNPSNPFGRSRLVIEVDGRAHLDHHTGGGFHTAWAGTMLPDALDEIWAGLDEAAFPRVAPHEAFSGSTLRTLSLGAGGPQEYAEVEYHAAWQMPGYKRAFWILDRAVRQLSEDTVKLSAEVGEPVVAG